MLSQPYVRPLLEYATPVWSPYTITNITKIESVGQQRSFTKRLPGISNLPYTKRLEFIGIDSVELPVGRSTALWFVFFVYKLLFGLGDLKFSDYLTLRANSTTRGLITNCFKPIRDWSFVNISSAKELFIIYRTRMLAINVSIPNLKIARLVQFWPWQ